MVQRRFSNSLGPAKESQKNAARFEAIESKRSGWTETEDALNWWDADDV